MTINHFRQDISLKPLHDESEEIVVLFLLFHFFIPHFIPFLREYAFRGFIFCLTLSLTKYFCEGLMKSYVIRVFKKFIFKLSFFFFIIFAVTNSIIYINSVWRLPESSLSFIKNPVISISKKVLKSFYCLCRNKSFETQNPYICFSFAIDKFGVHAIRILKNVCFLNFCQYKLVVILSL